MILPESSTSIEEARETLGNPGISIMLLEITTTKPAPAALKRGIGQQFEPDFAAFGANLLEVFIGKFQFARGFANREKSVGHERCGLLGAKEDERGRKGYHICGADHESWNHVNHHDEQSETRLL